VLIGGINRVGEGEREVRSSRVVPRIITLLGCFGYLSVGSEAVVCEKTF